MNEFKRAGLTAVEVLVVVVTVMATVVTLTDPVCPREVRAEVARGLSAGWLVAAIRVLVAFRRTAMACRSASCWWRYGWAVVRHEFCCGLIGGYLVGLALAMWYCWNG